MQIERLAYVDELTDMPNMNKFRIDAKALLCKNTNKSFAIVQFDVHRFKYINEIYGYQHGNLMLKKIANTLKGCMTSEGVIGRLGGDRFIMLMPYNTTTELILRLNNLQHDLSKCTIEVEESYKLVIHCGIYLVTDNHMNIDTMLDRAEMASASITGGYASACAFFDERMLDKVIEEQEIERMMQDALDRREFVVYLQPKYKMQDATIQGAEALVRWNHREKGIVSPGVFIPIIEKNGFIVHVDLMVYESVCALLKKWLDQGLEPVPISVNFSRIHLCRADFLTKLVSILEKYEVPAALLEIELTESVLLDNDKSIRQVLQQLKKLGFTLSIDDFGTGYSSLSLLQSIPADLIKLDREFLASESKNDQGKIVIANMIKLAHDLNMKVVAEGVETKEQVALLQSMKCDLAQGYYYMKPVPVEALEALLHGTRTVIP